MAERFQFQIDVTANPAAVVALTQATRQQTAATQQLSAAERARLALPVPDMVILQQRRQAAAETSRMLQQQAQERLRMGAQWEAQGKRGSMGQGGDPALRAGGLDAGRAALELSRAAEDAQYGIAGVLNNLPGLVMMLGGGAGLAGALSLAAVGATQLVKHLGDIGGAAINEEALKAKLAALDGILTASLDAMSARISASFEADLAAAQKAAEGRLNAWRESTTGLDAGIKAQEAARAAKAQAQADAFGLDQAMADAGATPEEKAQNAAAIEAQKSATSEASARASLDAEALAARQRRQIAEMGVKSAQSERSAAESVQGPFGSTSSASRGDILGRLSAVGIQSDQAKQVSGLDASKSQQEILLQQALEAETRRDGMSVLDPRRIGASLRAGHFRGKLSEQEQIQAQLEPGSEQARADLARGEVSFSTTDEKSLTPAQRAAFIQGRAELDAQGAREMAARKTSEDAKAKENEAAKAVEAARAEEAAIQAKREAFELQRQAGRVENGGVPDMSPEAFGSLQQRGRERAGLGDISALPGASFAPPDLSSTEQAFSAAMEQTSSSVTGTMERMVSASEMMARNVAGAMGGLQSKLSQLEANVSNLMQQQ